jgi:hypothetical protein
LSITNKNFQFNRNPETYYKLKEKIICYTDGYSRKVVPLKITLSYPIIYDNYIDQNDILHDLSIIVCPFTLSAIALEGIFTATKYTQNKCLIITNGQETFSILDVYKFPNIIKIEVSIKILRNIFTEHTDCKYLSVSHKLTLLPNIMPESYYQNTTPIQEKDFVLSKQHNQELENELDHGLDDEYLEQEQTPELRHDSELIQRNKFSDKTLIYILIYVSSKDRTIKRTILVGRQTNFTDLGYNIHTSGIYEYLVKYHEKIKEKHGFIIPTLWFACESFRDKVTVIYL